MEFMFNCLLFVLLMPMFCYGSDTLLPGVSLFTNQTLVSKGGKFELGFFNPGNSTNYYLGIWYKNIPVRTVVWVFNRNNPIPRSRYNYSRVGILSNGSFYVYMYPGVEEIMELPDNSEVSEAVILDTGNLLLRDGFGDILWESFDRLTDTWLPGMKHYVGTRKLYSWKNPYDPALGKYFLQLYSGESYLAFNQYGILWSQGVTFAALFHCSNFNVSFNFTNSSSNEYLIYNVNKESQLLRIVIDYLGRMVHYGWSEAKQAWSELCCNACQTCGPNTMCGGSCTPACRCLDGFVPRLKQDWILSDFSNGCVRNTPLECGHDKARYTKVTTITLPRNPQSRNVPNSDACNLACSENCSCTAYTYDNGGNCSLFMGNLSALVSQPNNIEGGDLYVKREPAHTGKPVLLVAIIVPIIAALIVSCFFFCYIWRKNKKKESGVTHQNLLQFNFHSSLGNRDEEEKNSWYELPIFSFSSIAASTNNFSISNKLGEGGFGPVYKGELYNGQFVAVKRLSRQSGQGIDEFKNETDLIAKLQHRNLVGILGCCVENDEMILVYEYMSNKSLDSFLFEPGTKTELLDWKRRAHIISGIAQGLLYLHHYSRIRIVHRDLKASNILLDAEMNPKISDFGMARIFGGNALQANTKRIVGTYGYMSPEYAMEGVFSVKSDVFAFGVLMLEIISGKKNTGFYGSENLSLLRYAWNFWKHDSAHELIDPTLEIPDLSSSVALRFIQIGLLCVEESPADRPLMSEVVSMLNNDKRAIPSPHNPGFTVGRSVDKATPTQPKVEICSVNELTVSNVEAR